jgi:hypothetical protein
LDPDWSTCVYTWTTDLKDLKSTEDLQSATQGSCGRVLSEQCLPDMKASAVARGKCLGAIGAPQSCKALLRVNGVSGASVHGPLLSWSFTHDNTRLL